MVNNFKKKSNKFNKFNKSNKSNKSNNDNKSWSINNIKKNNIDDGSDIILNNSYTLWCHDIYDKKWDINSFKNLIVINNVSYFWRLFNNFHKLGLNFNHYFFMKNNITPTWEDPLNYNGGVLSFKLDLNNYYDLWQELNIMMVCNLFPDNDNINGISISPKKNNIYIKIWIKNNDVNFFDTLDDSFKNKFINNSPKYIVNKPEF